MSRATIGRTWLDELASTVRPLDQPAMRAAADRLDQLTKPPGSLGRLEAIAIQLAGIRGDIRRLDRPAISVFAADHGIVDRSVSPYPAEVTRQMVATYFSGRAAVNVLATMAQAELVVVDVGVKGLPIEPPPSNDGHGVRQATLIAERVRAGTRDFSRQPALTSDETLAAIDAGGRVVDDLIARGIDVVGVGEMGIGNTTASSAIVAALTGRPAADVTGRGAGLDDAGVARKAAVIDAAIRLHRPDPTDPIGVLSAVGGLEIAALVGGILAGAAARVPVVLDGFITGAAALVASRLAPAVSHRLIAAHRSTEPGHAVVLAELGLDPILELDLRLGEGSGAALAIPIVQAASRILVEMATFEEAGVTNRG